MTEDVIVISSDESSSIIVIDSDDQSLPSLSEAEPPHNAFASFDEGRDNSGKSVVSSETSDEELFVPKAGKMKSDSDDLPTISYTTRDNRRSKHRLKLKHRHRYKYHENQIDSDEIKTVKKEEHGHGFYEPPRISPLPDLNILFPDLQSSNRVACKSERKPSRIKKKRPSVEQLRSQGRAILGDLFQADQAITIIPKKRTPEKSLVRTDFDRGLKTADIANKTNDVKHTSRSKHLSAPSKFPTDELSSPKLVSTPCRNESSIDSDKKQSHLCNKKNGNKTLKRSKSDSCSVSSDNCVEELERSSSADTPSDPVKVFSASSRRKESDASDMGHFNCYPRVSLFDIFDTMKKDHNENLNNVTISAESLDIDMPAIDRDDIDNETVTMIDCGINTSFLSVRSELFSDISEEEESVNSESEQFEMTKPESVSVPGYDEDKPGSGSVEFADCVKNSVEVGQDEMPVLKKSASSNSVCNYSNEMPVLERFLVEFSGGISANDEETLPDIEDNSHLGDKTEVMSHDTLSKSSQFSKTNGAKSDNIFSMFSCGSQIPTSMTPSKSLSSVSSSSVCSISSVITSVSSSPSSVSHSSSVLKSAIASVSNECSSLQCLPQTQGPSLKRKLGKKSPVTVSSLCRKSVQCSSSGFSKSYDKRELILSAQMEQLSLYLSDFINLNEKKCAKKYYLPESYKGLVFCCEEADSLNVSSALDFIEPFSKKYIIPSDICYKIIESAFHSNTTTVTEIHRSYKVLSTLLKERTGSFDVSWETIENCLKVTLGNTSVNSDKHLLQSTLLLELNIQMLKLDLYTRELTDSREIRTCQVYKILTPCGKSLIYYLNKAVHAGQCTTSNRDVYKLPDVLLLLQDLFTLCVEVSSSCIDCANTLSAEMVTTYKYLPSLRDKKRLIQSVTSPLLQYKLVQGVLEAQYDGYQTVGSAFPDSLEDIVQCFFKVMPLKNPMTPPTTPTDEPLDGDNRFGSIFTPADTEEIAMLCYFGVISYLRASHDKLHMALRRRANVTHRQKKHSKEDKELLLRMEEHVAELENHLRGMSSDLTPATQQFLFLLACHDGIGM